MDFTPARFNLEIFASCDPIVVTSSNIRRHRQEISSLVGEERKGNEKDRILHAENCQMYIFSITSHCITSYPLKRNKYVVITSHRVASHLIPSRIKKYVVVLCYIVLCFDGFVVFSYLIRFVASFRTKYPIASRIVAHTPSA